MKSVDERFWTKVDRKDDNLCWPWLAGRVPGGYGAFWVANGHVPAHRYSYERLVGPIPVGLQIDHLCRNRACVNPAHMEPVTLQENVRRGSVGSNNSVKTHCRRGHIYGGANLYVVGSHRMCRACMHIATVKYRSLRKMAT